MLHRSRRAEVNNHIPAASKILRIADHRNAVLFAVMQIDTGHHPAVLPLPNHIAEDVAHPAADALDDNIQSWLIMLSVWMDELNAGTTQLTGHSASSFYDSSPCNPQSLLNLGLLCIARLYQGQAAFASLPAQQIHGILHRDRLTSQNMASLRGSISS